MTISPKRILELYALALLIITVSIGVTQESVVNYEAALINPIIAARKLALGLLKQQQELLQPTQSSQAPTPTQTPVAPQTNSGNALPDLPTIPESELFDALNNYRQSHERTQLVFEEPLCVYARQRAKEHQERLKNLKQGETPLDNHAGFQRDADSGQLFEVTNMAAVAENLAFLPNFVTATQVVEWGWDSSTSHRVAQLDNEWTHACLSGKYPFYVGIFGRR